MVEAALRCSLPAGAIGYRVLIVGDYLVFYVVVRRTVQVRRVLHGARRRLVFKGKIFSVF